MEHHTQMSPDTCNKMQEAQGRLRGLATSLSNQEGIELNLPEALERQFGADSATKAWNEYLDGKPDLVLTLTSSLA